MAQRAARPSHQVGRLIARVIPRLDGWCPIRASEGQDPAYRATLLYFLQDTLKTMSKPSRKLVEVLADIRLNLQRFAGNSAGNKGNSAG